VAGLVTHRQRPPTARGVVFMSLEDETGMVNVICPPHVWDAHKKMASVAPALLIGGRIERNGNAVNLVAERLRPLKAPATVPSRDFRLRGAIGDGVPGRVVGGPGHAPRVAERIGRGQTCCPRPDATTRLLRPSRCRHRRSRSSRSCPRVR